MRLGAFKLNMGVRPAPESRSQLGLITAGEDGEAKEGSDAYESAVTSVTELSAGLPQPPQRPSTASKELASLPPAALHFTIELREDGNKPSAIEIAFSDNDTACVRVDPSRFERLQTFIKRVLSLDWRDHGDGQGAAKLAIRLPALRIELEAAEAMNTAAVLPATPTPDVYASANGVTFIVLSPPAERLPNTPAHYGGPMRIRAKVDTLHVGLPQQKESSAAVPPLLSSTSSALDIRFEEPADWLSPPFLTVAITPLRLALTPEAVTAAASHATG